MKCTRQGIQVSAVYGVLSCILSGIKVVALQDAFGTKLVGVGSQRE